MPDVGQAIDDGVVGLGQHREPTRLHTLDEVHLPQRAVAVELAAHDSCDQLVQLLVGARPRQRRPVDVVGDVELLVVHPHRVGDAPGRV